MDEMEGMQQIQFDIDESDMSLITAAHLAYDLYGGAYDQANMPRRLLELTGNEGVMRKTFAEMEFRLLKARSPLSLTQLFNAWVKEEIDPDDMNAFLQEIFGRIVFGAEAILAEANSLELKEQRKKEQRANSLRGKVRGVPLQRRYVSNEKESQYWGVPIGGIILPTERYGKNGTIEVFPDSSEAIRRPASEVRRLNLDRRDGRKLTPGRACAIVRTLAHNAMYPKAAVNPFREIDRLKDALRVTNEALESYAVNPGRINVPLKTEKVTAIVPSFELTPNDAVRAIMDLFNETFVLAADPELPC